MTTDDVQSRLVKMAARERAAAATTPRRWPTPACVPLSRLFTWVETGDPTGVDLTHLAACEFCRAAEQKLRAPVHTEPVPAEPAMPSELLVRHDVWARPRASRATYSGVVRGASAQPIAFVIGDGPAGGNVPLTPELSARYYAPELRAVGLTVVLFPVANGWVPRVQLDPAPNRGEPIAVTVTFPDGSVRSFVIPSGPPAAPTPALSEPAEVLPAAVIGDPSAGWQGSVELT